MTELTEAEAARLEAKLAAHREAQEKAARTAENERRKKALTDLEPVRAIVQDKAFQAKVEALREVLPALWSFDEDIANLTRNALVCVDGLSSRIQLRVDTNQPEEAPKPPAAAAG